MLAQIVLTPAESKKLIAKAIVRLEAVQQAVKKGIVALHPSSSTYFIFVEQSKGARLPDLRLCNCDDCPVPNCRFPMTNKRALSPAI